MPNAFYVSLVGQSQGNIEGPCAQPERENTIMGYAFTSEVATPYDPDKGKPKGSRTHTPITFTKEVDKTSPQLWKAAVTGENLTSVKFDFWQTKDAGGEESFYTIELEDARIIGMRTDMEETGDTLSGPAKGVQEIVKMTFNKITWTFLDGRIVASDLWENRR